MEQVDSHEIELRMKALDFADKQFNWTSVDSRIEAAERIYQWLTRDGNG